MNYENNDAGQNRMNAQFLGGTPVHIEKLIMTPVKEQHNMVQRSMSLNVNNNDLNNLYSLFDQSKSGRISAIDVSKVAPTVMRMNDNWDRQVNIANGWATERFRFIMVVATQMTNGAVARSYVQGYTNYADQSYSGIIDPSTILYFNSIINTVTQQDPRTHMFLTRVRSAYNIVYDQFSQSYNYQLDNETLRLLRPQDVVGELEQFDTYGAGEQVLNMTNIKTHMPQVSKGGNRVGASHLSDVLNAFSTAKMVTSAGYDASDIFTNAQAAVGEENLNNVPFIERLAAEMHELTPGYAPLSILERISPDLGQNTYVAEQNQAPINETAMFTQNVEDLSKITVEATIASMVADMASGIMMDNLLTNVAFSMSNMNYGTELVEAVLDVNSVIPDIDQRLYIQRFMTTFRTIAMPQITQNNLLAVEIIASIDIMGSARVQVMVEGNNVPVVYNIPLYADSLFTSVVSSNDQYQKSMDGYGSLVNLVTSSY